MNWQNTKEYELHVMNQDKLKWLHVWFAVLLFLFYFIFEMMERKVKLNKKYYF